MPKKFKMKWITSLLQNENQSHLIEKESKKVSKDALGEP